MSIFLKNGANSWREVPSMAIELTHAKDQDGKKVGVKAFCDKDRAVNLNPRLTIRFNLVDGEMELLKGGGIVGSCL